MILHRRQVRAMTYEVALVEGLTRAGEQFGYCRVLAMRVARPFDLQMTKSWQICCTVEHDLLLTSPQVGCEVVLS